MSGMLEILGLLVPVLLLGGIGALVFLIARGAHRGTESITSRGLLRAYLRFAYLISLVIFLVGATFTLTAAFGSVFGRDFSYSRQVQPGPHGGCAPPPYAPYGSPPSCVDTATPKPPPDNRQADDLIRGLSLLVAGLVIGSGHRVGQLALESASERRDSGLARVERLLATFGFGLVVLVAVPTAAYQVLRLVVLGAQADPNSGPPNPPGAALATALVFLVAWGYYLSILVRQRGNPAATAAAT